MFTKGKGQFPPRLDRWLTERKVKIELLLSVLVAVSLLAYFNHLNEGPTMVMMSMTTLAIFYFLSAHLTPDIDAKFGAIAFKVLSLSCSVCVIGLMFSILKYEGAEQMIFIGTTSLAISGLILAFYAISSGLEKLGPLLVRIVGRPFSFQIID